MKQFKKTAIALGLAQMTMMLSGVAVAQTSDAAKTSDTPAAEPVAVVVTGQRRRSNRIPMKSSTPSLPKTWANCRTAR
jgi:hypothetical protein